MNNNLEYWVTKRTNNLFSEVDLDAPEQRRFAGKILIIGGNRGQFFAVASALETAKRMGAGEVRALMPDSLRNQVPSTPELYFAPAEASGAFGKASLEAIYRQAEWADAVILIGDCGKNAETSMAFAEFLNKSDKPVFITRDAIETVMPGATDWGLREAETGLFLTMPQLQKFLRAIYYPKVVTLTMPTNQLIETLHKFTLSYQMSVTTFHNGLIITAQDGEVISQALTDTDYTPISLWGGQLLTQAVVARVWNSGSKFSHVLMTVA